MCARSVRHVTNIFKDEFLRQDNFVCFSLKEDLETDHLKSETATSFYVHVPNKPPCVIALTLAAAAFLFENTLLPTELSLRNSD